MFDIFYSGKKPGLFAHEREANSIEHAQQLSRTRFFWWVTYLADLSEWDFLWEPVPWQAHQRHAWPSQHQVDAGVYLVPKTWTGETNYRTDQTITRLSSIDNWTVPGNIDPASFDFSWHPDYREPAYEYHFGTQWQIAGGPVYAGSQGIKLVHTHRAEATVQPSYWNCPAHVDPGSIDYSWHPDPFDPPYVYHFPSQWQSVSGVTFTVPGATDIKLCDAFVVHALPDKANWHIPDYIDSASIDYSWHPNQFDAPYVYHFPSQHQPASGVTYSVPGALSIKIVDDQQVVALSTAENSAWDICEAIDEQSWDWSWHPNPLEPPYNYVWGNQWNPAEYKTSVSYTQPGATEVKYMESRTTRLPRPELFAHNIAVSQFDYSWEPNPFDPPMTYVFGNQWNSAVLEPTVIYRAGADQIKYVDDIVATVAQDVSAWELLDDIEKFDYSWRPNPTDPPYIYVFGNQWLTPEQRPAVQYRVGNATEVKYMHEPRARRVSRPELFVTHSECDFDYSWEPDPGSPPYIYVFGNQWYSAERMPTVEYAVAGATERKYMTEPVAKLPEKHNNKWHTLVNCEWDYSWCPDPGDPPYIYVFGNQWHPAELMSTVEYHVPGATERKYMTEPVAKVLPDQTRWHVPEEVNADNIDYSWIPDPGDAPYIYHFGTEYQSSVGLTYTVPGAVDIKFAGEIPRVHKEKKAVHVQDIFYMDRSNALSQQRFVELQLRYPHIQKIRYVNSIQDTVKRCLTKTKQNRFWVVGSENDYSEFDFAWHAQPWQSGMTHVFGSQWNKWSDTFLINRWEFERHAKWAKSIEEFPNLNFVQDQLVHAPADAHDIYVIDFGNKESADVVANLESRYRVVKKARYFDNYLDTFKRLLDGVTAEHVWVVGSVCDYSTFDFSWQPEAWQRDMLHVFPSNEQKFGDTFFVPVQKLREKIADLELLDWFDTVNYCTDQTVARWPMPIIHHQEDSQVTAVLSSEWAGPFALFTNEDYVPGNLVTVPLWREKVKSIVPLDLGASSVIVPKSAVPYIKTQLYDYPNINKSHRILKGEPLDIVFISNGEPNADLHFSHLNSMTYNLENRLHRVDGVNGRVASQRAAAQVATTKWYFVVPAKLEVDLRFDWAWQPDRMQQPKHYIFHAGNPVNGLVYGHQAMVAYNKKLVLETTGNGLDFTMEKAHEVVPIVSGVANYAESPWMAWRTAFREVIKLQHSLPDVESEYRLKAWLREDSGTIANGHWSHKGAQDAVEYYKEVQGDVNALKKSYEWSWLASYAFVKRGISTVE